MKKFLLSLLTLFVATATAWADETTYIFTTKDWGDTTNSWTSGKGGNQLTSGRGVQVTSGASGANATTKSSFSDVSGIEVVYSTNASKGKGSIVVQVGTGSAKTFNVTPVGTADTSTTFSFSPAETGAVKLTVNCTENSIYIKSVTITTGGGSGPSTVDTPVISPASKTFSEAFQASITCTTEGATILYSLDGSTPSLAYSGPITIPAGADVTLKAKATMTDWNDSQVAEAVYTYLPPTVATPVISPATQNFSEDFNATITCATEGATILYSVDGSTPSLAYSGPITIPAGADVTLKAKATKTNWNDSQVTEAVYTFVPPGATYQLVDIADITSSDIVVIYDTNSECAMPNDKGTGDAPSATPVRHSQSGTELVFADVTDNLKWNIETTDSGYIIYPAGQTAKWLYCTNTNNGVRVGTNDNKTFVIESIGTSPAKLYLKHVATSRYLGVYKNNDDVYQDWRCYLKNNGNIASNIANQNTKFYRYVVPANQVATPSISPNGGSDLTEAQTVTLSCETDGASIYYTLDGSDPDENANLYSESFQVSTDTTVKAIAMKSGMDNSLIAEATFQFRVMASSIAELYQKASGGNTVYVNFPMTVTAVDDINTFVQDGQNGYSVIYKNNNTPYVATDIIPLGWFASTDTVQGLIRIRPTAETPESSTSGSVTYPVISASDITVQNQCKPGTINNVVISSVPTSDVITATAGGTSITLYNATGTSYGQIAAGKYNAKGVVSIYQGSPQFTVIELTPVSAPNVYILGNINENNKTWAPNVGLQMTYNSAGDNYTARITVDATGADFNFATALGSDSNWDNFNGHDYRWGVQGGGDHNVTFAECGTVLGAQLWDYNPGAWVVPEGTYDLTFTFTGEYSASLVIEKISDVYILGNVNGNAWAPNQGVQMTRNATTGVFTATISVGAAGGSFNMATALGEDSDWTHFNGKGYRWGVQGGSDHNVTTAEYGTALGAQKQDNNPGAWVLPVGNYNLTWTFTGYNTATLVVEKAPSDVYIIGSVNDLNWHPNEGIKMVRDEDTGIYTAEVYANANDLINFAHALVDDADDWEHMNTTGNRFSVDQSDNYTVNGNESDILLAYNNDPASIKFANSGKYEVGVDLDDNGLMTAYVTRLPFPAPTFSVASKEFCEPFDITITGPEGSTITYVLNDDLENAVTVDSNVAELTIPAEDTSVLAWATIFDVDSESAEEEYIYFDMPAGDYWAVKPSDPIRRGKYLIVCGGVTINNSKNSPLRDVVTVTNPVFNGGADNLDSHSNYVATPRSGDYIGVKDSDNDYYFTITPMEVEGKENTYSIQAANGLYIGNSTTSNTIQTSSSPLVNTIAIDDDGNAIITGTGGKVLRYNSTSGATGERFRYMSTPTSPSTTNNPVQLYYNGQTEVTGVDKVAASDSEVVSTAYYNLQGVRLAAPAQGQIAIRVSTLANGQIRASKVVVR